MTSGQGNIVPELRVWSALAFGVLLFEENGRDYAAKLIMQSFYNQISTELARQNFG